MFSNLKTPGEKADTFLKKAISLDPSLIDEFVADMAETMTTKLRQTKSFKSEAGYAE